MTVDLEGKTGVLDVVLPGDRRTLTWNGEVADRTAARDAFNYLVKRGGVLATVVTEPGKALLVRDWSEVEEVEKEQGVVSVVVSSQIRGGAS